MKEKIIILALLLGLVAGCSHMSVRHLDRNQLQLNQTEQLSMRYWNFEYVSLVENGDYVVRGVALPRMEVIPAGEQWLHDFWLSVYLSDEKGKVVARDLEVFLPQKLDPVEGIRFEFSMSPERIPATRDVFLTFGYRMRLTEDRYYGPLRERPLTGDKSVFFASEGALAR